MEWVLAGRTLQRCRTEFLSDVRSARSALILGEGNGRFVCDLLKANPEGEIVCVDGSRKMLEIARNRIVRQGLEAERVEFVQADVLDRSRGEWRSRKFDLVVTHFFLDCFRPEQLRELIAAIADATSGGALWLLADFRVPERGLARFRARAILWLAYRFFRVTVGLPAKSLTAPDESLAAADFRLSERRLYECGLLHSDLWRKNGPSVRQT